VSSRGKTVHARSFPQWNKPSKIPLPYEPRRIRAIAVSGENPMELILIIVVVLFLFGGGGYWGRRRGHW
jgi:hypothetical protein